MSIFVILVDKKNIAYSIKGKSQKLKKVLGNCNLISDWENDGSAENKTLVYTLIGLFLDSILDKISFTFSTLTPKSVPLLSKGLYYLFQATL